VALQASYNISNLSRLSMERQENEVKSEITRAYYTAIVAEENILTLEATFATLEKIFSETQAIATSGLGDQQDADQLSLTVSNLRSAISRAKLMRDASYMGLKLQMGMKLDAPLALSESLESIIAAVDIQLLSNEIFNPSTTMEYQMLETQVKLMELSLRNEKMDYLPTAGAFFSQQYQAFRNDFDFFADKPWYPATIWGLQLNIPILSSGMRNAKVEQAQVELNKSKLTLEEAAEAMRLQAFVVRTEFLNAVEAYNLQKQSLELARKIEQNTLIRFKAGDVGSMDLTIAQNQYLAQQGYYVNAMFTLLSAKAQLDKIFNHYLKQN
jgi:outer membrane protein